LILRQIVYSPILIREDFENLNFFTCDLSIWVNLMVLCGAVVTGMAGAVFYIFQGYVDPASVFDIRWTIAIMLSTVWGGIRTEKGPIVGAAVVVFLHFLLLAKYPGISLLIQGVILTGIMLLAPHGMVGTLQQKWAFRSSI